MRHALPALMATALLVALGACGEDGPDPAATEPPAPTATDDTTPPDTNPPDANPPGTDVPDTNPPDTNVSETNPPGTVPGYEHPTGADEVVLSYAEVGGFTTREFAFQNPPVLLVTGDGRVITPAAVTAVFPGPLVAPLQIQSITEEGIQALLAAADDAGLLREVDYADDAEQLIADASTAQVEIAADGETWVHSAYALGIDSLPAAAGDGAELSPDRAALQDFVESLADLGTLVGAENLGEQEIYEPSAYQLLAFPVDDPSAFERDGIEPTLLDWPTDAGVSLADAESCVEVDADMVGPVLTGADELTLFADDGTTYQVLARPVIPGRTCDS